MIILVLTVIAVVIAAITLGLVHIHSLLIVMLAISPALFVAKLLLGLSPTSSHLL
jgi:hypothetical protein